MSWKSPLAIPNPEYVYTHAEPSQIARRACAHFGLVCSNIPPDHALPHHHELQRVITPNQSVMNQIQSARTTLIAGESGAGKSSLLRGLQRSLERLLLDQQSNTSSNKVIMIDLASQINNTMLSNSLLDCLDGSMTSRLDTLSKAGLAEPKLWMQACRSLSAGEKCRVILAIGLHHARPGDWLIVDELCSLLDRMNAQALAWNLKRSCIRKNINLICATAHEDMASFLQPDVLINAKDQSVRHAKLHSEQDGERHQVKCLTDIQITVECGSIDDLKALLPYHYLGSKPATCTHILRATRSHPTLGTPVLAGVLAVSMPTLNSSWRDRAWPGMFKGRSKMDVAKTINEELRCISRVIVHPHSRGIGIARRLVEHYLQNPQTHATEAVAAMGTVCPFFEQAGMRSYPIPRSIPDLRLLDAMEHEHVHLDTLCTTLIPTDSLLARELLRWARTRKLAPDSLQLSTMSTQECSLLASHAACRLSSRPRAYAHVFNGGDHRDESKDKTKREQSHTTKAPTTGQE